MRCEGDNEDINICAIRAPVHYPPPINNMRSIIKSTVTTAIKCNPLSFAAGIRSISAVSSFQKKFYDKTQLKHRVPSAPLINSLFQRFISTSSPPFSNSLSASPEASVDSSIGISSQVITLAGPDRVGIVADLSQAMTKIGANIEESRMTILGADFAILLRITIGANITAGMVQAQLQKIFHNFLVTARSTNMIHSISTPVRIRNILLEGPDQPSIVSKLTSLFVKHNISVRDLDTDTSSAAFAGYKIFTLKTVVAIPTSVDIDRFYEDLTEFENNNGVEIEVSEPGADQQHDHGNGQLYQDEVDQDENDEFDEEEEEEYPEPVPQKKGGKQHQTQQQHQHQNQKGQKGVRLIDEVPAPKRR
jgi:glycine cleavage system transcriptional repressor